MPGPSWPSAGGWSRGSTLKSEAGLLAGLAEVAAALGLAAGVPDERAAGRAVRHRLEADGDRCLLVFDNATDPGLLRPFMPAAGAARVIITSNQQSVAALGAGVPVDVFSEQEALTFLAARTGHADAGGALALAEELGWLPLALAQAAAVIASQYLPYATYLDRLRRLPAGRCWSPSRRASIRAGLPLRYCCPSSTSAPEMTAAVAGRSWICLPCCRPQGYAGP